MCVEAITMPMGLVAGPPADLAGAAAGGSSIFGSMGTGMQIAGVLSGALGARQQSQSTQRAYEYQAAVNRNNAQVAEWQARDALDRGARAEQTQRLKTAALKSTQRAGFAARGVSLEEGSPLAILQDTDYMGELDALTLRDNAAREAWGHRVNAGNYRNEAALFSSRAEAESPLAAGFSSLLTGAGRVASSWYSRRLTTG